MTENPARRAGWSIGDDYEAYTSVVASERNMLRDAGVDGPYAVALGERCYTDLTETVKAGYPILEHVRRIVEGPIVWAPGLWVQRRFLARWRFRARRGVGFFHQIYRS